MLIEIKKNPGQKIHRIIEDGRTRKRRRRYQEALETAVERANMAWHRGEDQVEIVGPRGVEDTIQTCYAADAEAALRSSEQADSLINQVVQWTSPVYLEAWYADREALVESAVAQLPKRAQGSAQLIAAKALFSALAKHPLTQAASKRVERRRRWARDAEATRLSPCYLEAEFVEDRERKLPLSVRRAVRRRERMLDAARARLGWYWGQEQAGRLSRREGQVYDVEYFADLMAAIRASNASS